MKFKQLATSLAALVLSTTFAFAADANNTTGSQQLVDASKLDGRDVYDFHGQKLGHLDQVLIDPQSGQVRYGVLEVDKTWSLNDPKIAVPWGSFAVKPGDNNAVNLSLDATKEKLENAPKFKAGDANRLFSKEASAPVYSYWSIYWFDEPMPAKSARTNTAAQPKATDQTSASNTNSGTTTGSNKATTR